MKFATLLAALAILPLAAHAETTCRETAPLSAVHWPQKTVAVRCFDDTKPIKPHAERCTVLYDHGRAVDFDAPCAR